MSADVDDLRERAAAALEAAMRFVLRYGDELVRLRARVLAGACDGGELERWLAERQSADGSLAAAAPADHPGATGEAARLGAPLAGTIEALAALGDARALAGPVVERAVAWLGATQRPDGSWGSWGGEGAPESRLVATGFTAGLLGRTRCVREAVLEGAGAFLAPLWSPERVSGRAWPATAAFSSFFSNVSHELADQALQWCGRELERGYRTGIYDAVRVARVFLYCDSSAVPGARLAPEELVEGLLAEQAADGGVAALEGGGPPARAPLTADAMLALVRLCRAL